MPHTGIGLCLMLIATAAPPPLAHAEADEVRIVESFFLEATNGDRIGLEDPDSEVKATVIAFLSVNCPINKLLSPRLARLEKKYREQGVRFLGIDPNIQDEPEEMAERARLAGIEFPVLMDPMQEVTTALEVVRTTEVLVLDAQRRIVYQGAVDDQYGVGTQKPAPRHHYMTDVLDKVLAGEEVAFQRTDAPGCLIGRVMDQDAVDITYHRDVYPILAAQCVECHRPGQIGPMAFDDYKETRGWAPMIAEVIQDNRMPPWHADPAHGTFVNQRRLTDTEKAILTHWAKSGAPEGDPQDTFESPEFTEDDWVIESPDIVVELPEEQSVPATGTIPYRYVTVDPQIEEDCWVQAIEIRPTNRAVTHHVLVFQVPPGEDIRSVLNNSRVALGSGHFAVEVPGMGPMIFPDGYGQFLPAGTRFVFQMHYTATGVAGTDRTRMGIRLIDEEDVQHEVRTRALVEFRIDIPPGEQRHEMQSSHLIEEDMRVLALFPHLHSRGTSFKIELESEHGSEVLLNVPHYDFNWQHTYMFENPRSVHKGERIRMTASWDNSESNPMNPDPSRRVRWGDQTWEEMFVGYVTYIHDGEAPPGE